MVFFNWATMQMAAKIVYYGPGLCGKTTNLSFIYAKTSPNSRGEMVSLETESDRTLFFDLLPIEVGTIGGFKTRLQLYTVPGQVFYNTTRKLVLKGVDGVVFVADSQRPMREANVESFANLKENLSELGLDLEELPLVLQYNKRDLANILSIDELNADLNANGVFPFFEASAINGDGVFETLKEITKITLKKLRKRMAAPQGAAGPRAPEVKPPPAAQPRASISAAALARAAEEGVEEAAPVAAAQAPPAGKPRERVLEVVPPVTGDEEAAAAAAPTNASPTESGEAYTPSPDEITAVQDIELPEEPEDLQEAGPDEEQEPFEEAPAVPEAEEEAGFEAVPETAACAEDETPQEAVAEDAGEDVTVDFDRSADEIVEVTPPPIKRVHVSNQMDILAELDSLREQATMGPARASRGASQPDLDIESLLAGDKPRKREVERTVSQNVNSDVFARTSSLQVAIRLMDTHGDTIQALDPISLPVDDISNLDTLAVRLKLDLENQK